MKKLLILVLSFCLISCANYPNNRSYNIKEITEEGLEGCKLIGQVYGDYPVPFLTIGLDVSMHKAKQQAKEIGATHVMWQEVKTLGAPYASGRAYRCKS